MPATHKVSLRLLRCNDPRVQMAAWPGSAGMVSWKLFQQYAGNAIRPSKAVLQRILATAAATRLWRKFAERVLFNDLVFAKVIRANDR